MPAPVLLLAAPTGLDLDRVLGAKPVLRGLILFCAPDVGLPTGLPHGGWTARIETPNVYDFVACYRALAAGLPGILKVHDVAPRQLVVEPGEAPPAMVSALTLASSPFTTTLRFPLGEANPWEALAIGRAEAAVALFDRARFEDAADRFGQLAALSPEPTAPLFGNLVRVARTLHRWDRMLYACVEADLLQAAAGLHEVRPRRLWVELSRLVDAVKSASGTAQKLEQGDPAALLRDLIANADRRARDGLYVELSDGDLPALLRLADFNIPGML